MTTDGSANLAGVERALGVLNAFDTHHNALRVADVARVCGVSTSAASRLLATLVAAGMVDRDDSGLYNLGHRVLTLAGRYLNSSAVTREARGVAYSLSAELGLGANLAELRDEQVFYLLNFDGHFAPRTGTLMGQHNALHATGLGKCLLSALSTARRRSLLGTEPYPSYTANTITTYEAFEQEVATVRALGFATEHEELALGRSCIAAPVRDRSGEVIAALSLSGPLSAMRLDLRERELGQRLLEAADRISTALGAVPQAMALPDGIHTIAAEVTR